VARVLITGSADGLGLMAAVILAGHGHAVTLHARNESRAGDARTALPSAESVVVGDLPTSRRRPPPRPICAAGTWTGRSCAWAASPMLLPPVRSGSWPCRSPVAWSPVPTLLRSLLPCSTTGYAAAGA
jgi:NAD(P)-dependent dehydrogenase (short-subunit alcohol dehydrogenase family)